jgi:hypothetical protein
MPATARTHFNQDIARASALVEHAAAMLPPNPVEALLRDDLLRSGWMFAVGAMDAYFCDAYVSLLVKSLRAKSLQGSVVLPPFISRIEVPIGSILAAYANRPNWRWRMAARAMMEKDNVLALDTVRKLFNPFFPEDHKFFSELIDDWITRPHATAHIFGIARAAYLVTQNKAREDARKSASKHFLARFKAIIQRRHDCIHNCDRPKNVPQPVGNPGSVRNVIRDVRFLVENSDAHIDEEFGEFLIRINCDAVTRNALGY